MATRGAQQLSREAPSSAPTRRQASRLSSRALLGPALALATLAALAGCDPSAVPAPALDPLDSPCEALGRFIDRAAACDPSLAPLVRGDDTLVDPARCRQIVRELTGDPDVAPEPRSVAASAPPSAAPPLTLSELETLASLRLPAWLELTPDIEPRQGRPRTEVRLDGRRLEADAQGAVTGRIGPGAHELGLRFSGEKKDYCVRLRQCQRLSLTMYGASLGLHAAVTPGRCPRAAAEPRGEGTTGASDYSSE